MGEAGGVWGRGSREFLQTWRSHGNRQAEIGPDKVGQPGRGRRHLSRDGSSAKRTRLIGPGVGPTARIRAKLGGRGRDSRRGSSNPSPGQSSQANRV